MANHFLPDGRISEGNFIHIHILILIRIYLLFRFSLIRELQRAQKVFKAQLPLDLPAARNKLLGFGMQLLDGIDPNPDNMVCAGIIHTQGQQVGCLLRLEPNRQAQVCVNNCQMCKTII